MTDEPLSTEELEHLRDGGPDLGPTCSDCGAQPQLMSDGIPHLFHEEACAVMQRINELIDEEER
jgi:hypothetical protein